ncbi:MAG TPA: hypothetical protein VJB57_11710 [Dehalococcoidia bacterium]|nr:hypothetical protein [Dehalococcoidia bacterium]
MSKDIMSELLQECLSAYEAGLSPEECLAAYPSRRAELEPLLRQAVSLRVSYAAAPEEAFRARAKQALMFAAGREVSEALAAQPSERFVAEARHHLMFLAGRDAAQAFSAEPDSGFVENARRRVLNVAGASAQEALRAVPPPRLPFWWNTRRKLLETASMPRHQAAPRPFFGAAALRVGLSMAVLILAFAIGGFAYLAGQNATPSAASEIAQLERELTTLEARADAGQPVSDTEVSAILQRTSELAAKLNDKPATSGVDKLPALIERQANVVEKVYSDSSPPANVVQAQQQLDDQRTKLLAAGQATPVAAPGTSAPAIATSTPPATPTAVNTPVLPPPVGNQARVTVLGDGRVEIRTAALRVIAPKDWNIGGIAPDSNGVPVVHGNAIGLGGSGTIVLVNLNGQIEAIIANQPVLLRSTDAAGRVIYITADELVAKAGPVSQELPFTLRRILESFEMTVAPVVLPPPPPPATSTPLPTSTATPAATSTPAPATNTPAPATSTPVATSTPPPPTPTRAPGTPAPQAAP